VSDQVPHHHAAQTVPAQQRLQQRAQAMQGVLAAIGFERSTNT
jgi:hypothetical protein